MNRIEELGNTTALRTKILLRAVNRESMDLEQTVLERIVPPRDVVASIQERADRLKGIVEDYIASHGIDVEAKFAGSFSKGTFLSDPDLDLFLMFPCSVPEADLKRNAMPEIRRMILGLDSTRLYYATFFYLENLVETLNKTASR